LTSRTAFPPVAATGFFAALVQHCQKLQAFGIAGGFPAPDFTARTPATVTEFLFARIDFADGNTG